MWQAQIDKTGYWCWWDENKLLDDKDKSEVVWVDFEYGWVCEIGSDMEVELTTFLNHHPGPFWFVAVPTEPPP